MELLGDPQIWLSFVMLAMLEVVLGLDNILFLTLAVDRLPPAQRRRARLLGLSLAMATRIAFLFAVVELTALRRPLFHAFGVAVSLRDAVLIAGGAFLVVKSALELRAIAAPAAGHPAGAERAAAGIGRIVVEIALIDILFSIDTVFSAIGLASRVEVMVAAIVVSLPVMMGVSAVLGRFIERHPDIKVLALAMLALVGLYLLGEGAHLEIPRGYLYCAMGFAAAVEGLNIRLRTRG